MTAMNATGQMVLKLTADGTGVYFISPGASPKGDQPFVGVMPVGGGEEKILYRSSDPYYDEPVALALGFDGDDSPREPDDVAELLLGSAELAESRCS